MGHHIHHQHARPLVEREAQVVETVVNVVYVTAGQEDSASTSIGLPAQSSDPVAGGPRRQNGSPVQNTRASSAESTAVSTSTHVYSAPSRQVRPDRTPTSSVMTSEALYPTANAPMGKQHTTLVSSAIGGGTLAGSSAAFAAPAASGSSSGSGANITKSDEGLSGGAKAGIAIAVIIGVALIAAIAFFMYRRKKKQHDEHQRLDDEKSNLPKRSQSVASHVSVSRGGRGNAPRLSLRPVTQMFPAPMSEKQDGNSLTGAAAAGPRSRAVSPAPPQEDPFADQNEDRSGLSTPAAAAAPTPVTAKIDQASQPTPPMEGQAFAGAAAGSRRNSPPGPGPNNVHRVQLDFKPSMDDELELKAGTLVRMLHEYDDGWALCVRLDRSQQGVVPRTCISKLPVKPRPGPPPGARGPPPQGRPRNGSTLHSNAPGPRMSPPQGVSRPTPPPGARTRAQTNGPRRPQSPASFTQSAGNSSRPRANSDAMSARRITPPSPMSTSSSLSSSPPQAHSQMPARKPVPGQAM